MIATKRVVVIVAVAVPLATLASAAQSENQKTRVPVSGLYGTNESCQDAEFLVGPTGIEGLDISCMPTKVQGNYVRFSCDIEGNKASKSATIVENLSAGTVN
jgi:hypothetical protein